MNVFSKDLVRRTTVGAWSLPGMFQPVVCADLLGRIFPATRKLLEVQLNVYTLPVWRAVPLRFRREGHEVFWSIRGGPRFELYETAEEVLGPLLEAERTRVLWVAAWTYQNGRLRPWSWWAKLWWRIWRGDADV